MQNSSLFASFFHYDLHASSPARNSFPTHSANLWWSLPGNSFCLYPQLFVCQNFKTQCGPPVISYSLRVSNILPKARNGYYSEASRTQPRKSPQVLDIVSLSNIGNQLRILFSTQEHSCALESLHDHLPENGCKIRKHAARNPKNQPLYYAAFSKRLEDYKNKRVKRQARSKRLPK